jgi:hypothetical protein
VVLHCGFGLSGSTLSSEADTEDEEAGNEIGKYGSSERKCIATNGLRHIAGQRGSAVGLS